MNERVPPPPILSTHWIVKAPARRPQILLAEGDDLTARVVRHRLERDGMEVEVVCDGVAALDALAKKAYDVALVDAVLAGVDGLDLVRRIRLGEAGSVHLRVGVVCWPGNDALLARAYALDADDVMVRPLSLVALSASVARMARRSRRR